MRPALILVLNFTYVPSVYPEPELTLTLLVDGVCSTPDYWRRKHLPCYRELPRSLRRFATIPPSSPNKQAYFPPQALTLASRSTSTRPCQATLSQVCRTQNVHNSAMAWLKHIKFPGPAVFSCSGSGSAGTTTAAATSTSAVVTKSSSAATSAPAATSSTSSTAVAHYGQCGGST